MSKREREREKERERERERGRERERERGREGGREGWNQIDVSVCCGAYLSPVLHHNASRDLESRVVG